jgi:hypothetical protein
MTVSRTGSHRLRRVCAVLVAFMASSSVFAQQVEGLRGLTRPDDPLGMPSVGRIVGVLLLTIAIAIGALYAIRRWQPKLESHFTAGRSIKILERSAVGGTRLYLLQVDEQRVLLTEFRGHITTVLLPTTTHQQDSRIE